MSEKEDTTDNKKGYPRRNDAFFVKKRKIFREAE